MLERVQSTIFKQLKLAGLKPKYKNSSLGSLYIYFTPDIGLLRVSSHKAMECNGHCRWHLRFNAMYETTFTNKTAIYPWFEFKTMIDHMVEYSKTLQSKKNING